MAYTIADISPQSHGHRWDLGNGGVWGGGGGGEGPKQSSVCSDGFHSLGICYLCICL